MSSPSMITSPRLTPIRKVMRLSSDVPALRSPIPRWISTAHQTASTTLANSARKPSPVVLTMRPRCSVIFGSTSCPRCALSRSCVPSSSPPSAVSSPQHRRQGSRRDGVLGAVSWPSLSDADHSRTAAQAPRNQRWPRPAPMICGQQPAAVPNGWGAAGLPLRYVPVQPGISKEDAPWGGRVRRLTGTGRDHLRRTR
jgi:hypothetical protein